MPKIDKLLEIVTSAGASDLHLVVGSVPMIRVGSNLEKTRHRRLNEEEIRQLVYEIMTDGQIRIFEKVGNIDICYQVDLVGRARMNVYSTQSGVSVAIRLLPEDPPDLADLGFSETVRQLINLNSGLVLVSGPSNSGLTTSLASMIDYINTDFSRHIISLENPIEFVHKNKNSLVNQRQIGVHVQSYFQGVSAAIHENPDVVVIGDMTDWTTVAQAIRVAGAGTLVIGALHHCGSEAVIKGLVNMFPEDRRHTIRLLLAENLRGVISQQLIRRANGSGRILAYELMLQNEAIRKMIRENELDKISQEIQTEAGQGMRLMDNHLKALVDSGQISSDEAARVADEPARFTEPETENEKIEATA